MIRYEKKLIYKRQHTFEVHFHRLGSHENVHGCPQINTKNKKNLNILTQKRLKTENAPKSSYSKQFNSFFLYKILWFLKEQSDEENDNEGKKEKLFNNS